MPSPGGPEVGRISIKVIPDTDDFRREKIKADLEAKLAGLDLKAKVEAVLDENGLRSKARAAVKEAEEAAGDVDVKLDINTHTLMREVDVAIDKIKARATRARPSVELHANGKQMIRQAEISLNEIQAMARMQKPTVEIKPVVDSRKARFAMEKLRRTINKQARERKGLLRYKATLDTSKVKVQYNKTLNDLNLYSKVHPAKIEVKPEINNLAAQRVEAWLAAIAAERVDVDVKIKTHGFQRAIAQMGVLRATTERFNKTQAGVFKGARGWYALLKALLPLAPAIIPIGGAALGAAAGLGAMGAAGVAAGYGIYRAIKNNTKLGNQYKQSVQGITDKFNKLADLMAQDMFAPFAKSVKVIDTNFGHLSVILRSLGSIMGDTLFHGISSLVKMFQDASPVAHEFARGLQSIFTKLDNWTGSNAAASFWVKVGQQMQNTGKTVAALSGAFSHLFSALAPVGGAILSTFTGISHAISSIPTGALTALATGFVAIKLAGLGIALIGPMLTRLVVRANAARIAFLAMSRAVRVSGQSFATFRGAGAGLVSFLGGPMNVALLGIGAALTYVIMKRHAAAQAAEEHKQRIQSLTQAIEEDNGVLGKNTKQQIINNLQKDDAYSKAKQYGLSISQVTKAAMGNAKAQKQVHAALAKSSKETVKADGTLHKLKAGWDLLSGAFTHNGGQIADATSEWGQATDDLSTKQAELEATIFGNVKAFKAAKAAGLDNNAAMAAAGVQAGKTEAQWNSLNAAIAEGGSNFRLIGKSVGNLAAYMTQGKNAAAIAALAQMNYANATTKEKQAIDALNSALDTMMNNYNNQIATTYTAAAAQRDMMTALKKSGGSVNAWTEKGNAAGQAVTSWIQQLIQLKDANVKANGSINQANKALVGRLKKVKANVVATYGAKSAVAEMVQGYIDEYSAINKVPKKHSTKVTSPGLEGLNAKLKMLLQYFGAWPKEKSTKITAKDVNKAMTRTRGYRLLLGDLPPSVATELQAKAEKAKRNVISFQAKVDGLHGKKVTITDNATVVKRRMGQVQLKVNGLHGKTVTIDASTWRALQGIGTLKNRIASIRGKTVYIDVIARGSGISAGGRYGGPGAHVHPWTSGGRFTPDMSQINQPHLMSTFTPEAMQPMATGDTGPVESIGRAMDNMVVNVKLPVVQAPGEPQQDAGQIQGPVQIVGNLRIENGEAVVEGYLQSNPKKVYEAAKNGEQRKRRG